MVIHVSYLRECINKYDIEKIYIFGCDKNQIQSILSLKKDLNISIINSVDNDYTWLRWIASQLKFFLNTIFCIFIGKFFIKKKPNPKRVKRLFLTRYPLHLNNNLEEEKYGGMLEEGDFYLVGMVSDGIHQYLPVSKYFHHISKISKKSHKYVFIDSYLSVIECITNFIFSFLLLYKARKLFKENYEFNSINISVLIIGIIIFNYLVYFFYTVFYLLLKIIDFLLLTSNVVLQIINNLLKFINTTANNPKRYRKLFGVIYAGSFFVIT